MLQASMLWRMVVLEDLLNKTTASLSKNNQKEFLGLPKSIYIRSKLITIESMILACHCIGMWLTDVCHSSTQHHRSPDFGVDESFGFARMQKGARSHNRQSIAQNQQQLFD